MPKRIEQEYPLAGKRGVPDILLTLFPVFGFLAGVGMWLLDAAIDVLFVHPDDRFIESVFTSNDTELWMRSLVLIVMTASALFAQYLLRREKQVEKILRHHKQHLELLVEERTQELERVANLDELTKVYNRRKFNAILHEELQRAQRYKHNLSVILCDLDHFKQINDLYGHDIGDSVLVNFANCLRNSLRQSDVYARWGGEEFIILLPHASADEARIAAQKLCDLVPGCSGKKNNLKVSASFGVAQLSEYDSAEELLKRADQALYQAKHEGRQRVCVNRQAAA